MQNRAAYTILATVLCIASAAESAIAPAWVVISRRYSDGNVYLWNTGTKEAYRLYERQQWDDPNPEHGAFSPDGKRIAFIVKREGSTYGVMVVNNDGTGLERVCGVFNSGSSQSFCNICWTDRGLFWTENTREIYWADPDTKQSRALGTLATNTTGNHLRMSRDGARAYLRTSHDLSPDVGGLFFETDAGLTGIINERPFGHGEWDHGSVMLNDGSECIWVIWDCPTFGSPSGCSYHNMFGRIDFVNPAQRSTFIPDDGYQTGWELDGPGWGPYTTPNSDDHILYNRYGTGDNEGHVFFIMDLGTDEVVEVTPTEVASGSDVASFNPDFDVLGEFWLGDLPNPHATTPAIALDKASLLFTDQTQPIPTQTVTVTNIGAGTLGTIAVAESPDAPWLALTVGGTGNTQTITVAPSSDGLAAGTHQTTVTVSGGGASNTRTFTVSLSVGATIQAPTGLSAVHSAGGIDLTWTDNADNETGFQIQRRTGTAAFADLASVGADVTTCRDNSCTPGEQYGYRVRATTGSESSSWSDTVTAGVPLPPIVVSAPAAGDTISVGDTLHILWSAPTIQTIQIQVTYDEGETWTMVTATGGISQDHALWGDYPWVVPDSVGTQPAAMINVSQYQELSVSGLSGVFTIISTSVNHAATARQRSSDFAVNLSGAQATFTCMADDAMLVQATVSDLRGRVVAEWRGRPAAGTPVSVWHDGDTAGSGLYTLRLSLVSGNGETRSTSRRFMLTDN